MQHPSANAMPYAKTYEAQGYNAEPSMYKGKEVEDRSCGNADMLQFRRVDVGPDISISLGWTS
jgi:hypothetical protein